MVLFNLLFPKEAAQLKLNSRRLSALMVASGLDDGANPALTGVITELRAGHDIKAAQLYCQETGASVAEGHLAVRELKQQLGV